MTLERNNLNLMAKSKTGGERQSEHKSSVSSSATPKAYSNKPLLPFSKEIETFLNRLDTALWVFDVDNSEVVWANRAGLEIWAAASIQELQARDLKSDMSPAIEQRLRQYQADFEKSDAIFTEMWTLYPQGKPIPVWIQFSGFPLDDGRIAMLCEGRPGAQTQPEALRSADALLHTRLMISLHTEEGDTLYLNPAARATFDSNNNALADRFANQNDYRKVMEAVGSDGETSLIAQMSTATGHKWHELTARRCFDPVSGQPSVLVSQSDVSDLKAAEAHAKTQALTDPLTNLPNRLGLPAIFNHMVIEAERNNTIIGVYFIDLDQFKNINDTLGHVHGDTLLVHIADTLRGICGPDDAAVRIGGDEFLYLAMAPASNIEQLSRRAEELLGKLSHPVSSDGRRLNVTPSIGIARWPYDTENIHGLMKFADLAMYEAKAAGRNQYCFFEPWMNESHKNELELLTELREGLDAGQFEVHYQPRLDAKTKKITAVEALARWHHPKRGLVYPADFIPLCEKSGLIKKLGAFVLQTAIKQHRKWRKQGHCITVAVNVSQRQLNTEDFAEDVEQVICNCGCEGKYLELEMTETLVVEGSETVHTNIERVRQMGVRVAIDDFGTGYSNFARLNDMAVDCIKIDRSLVLGLPDTEGLLKIVVAMCRMMNVTIVAEGIETAEADKKILELECDELQGFYYARPMPADDVTQLLMKSDPGSK